MNQWLQCNQMEDVHPKSVRSSFAQNTNIWAVHKDAKSASAAVVSALRAACSRVVVLCGRVHVNASGGADVYPSACGPRLHEFV
eukprot:364877-Chlamydomonas_euryale.AAC.6